MPRHHGTRKEAIMQMSDYALAQLANERLAHAREVAARRALVRSLPRRESLRVRLGGVLVALGGRLRRQGAGRTHPRRADRARAATRPPLDDRARHRRERGLAAPARASRLRPRRSRARGRVQARTLARRPHAPAPAIARRSRGATSAGGFGGPCRGPPSKLPGCLPTRGCPPPCARSVIAPSACRGSVSPSRLAARGCSLV